MCLNEGIITLVRNTAAKLDKLGSFHEHTSKVKHKLHLQLTTIYCIELHVGKLIMSKAHSTSLEKAE